MAIHAVYMQVLVSKFLKKKERKKPDLVSQGGGGWD